MTLRKFEMTSDELQRQRHSVLLQVGWLCAQLVYKQSKTVFLLLACFRPRIAACSALLCLASACMVEGPTSLTAESEISGEDLVAVYGCTNCHVINGSSANPGNIGPPLTGWVNRKYIAGRIPNQPSQLVRWIVDPQAIDPGTAMPKLGVTEAEAIAMADYLYSQ